MIQFGEWLPDQPDHANQGVTVATNVIPASYGYRPVKSFVTYSNSATGTIRGIFAAKDNSGNVKLFAGDSSKLYNFTASTSNLDDVSKVGGYTLNANAQWRFSQFGNYVIASGSIGTPIQKWQLGVDSAFSDLSASAPKADFSAVVRDFVWLANVDEGSGRVPYRCSWSGFNDITSWTPGVDQSDFQDLPDSGAITGLVGGEYATILCERAIFRATFTGPPLIWQFDKVESQRGCSLPGSVCNYGSMVFYLADNGFHAFDGQKSVPIGNEKIDKFFFSDFNAAYKNRVTASVDPLNQIAVWSYPSNSSVTGEPDKLLIYNYSLNRWSIAEITVDFIAPFFSAGYTVDGLDNLSATLDGLNTVLDSQFFRGGEFFFGGALGDKLGTFTGDVLRGTIETGEAALAMGRHGIVTRIYPYYEGIEVFIEIGTRNNQLSPVTYTSQVAVNGEGFSPFRAEGRYHRARVTMEPNWEKAQGIDIEARQIGRR